MGNQPSRSTTPTSNPTSPSVSHAAGQHQHHHTNSHGHHHFHHHPHHQHHASASHPSRELNPAHPRRRESIQALSVKASVAPPSASFETAAQSTLVRPHSRSRSQTIATGPTSASSSSATALHHHNPLHVIQTTLKHASASEEKMGNEQSRQKGHHPPREQATPPRDKEKAKPTAAVLVPAPAPAPALQQPTAQSTQPLQPLQPLQSLQPSQPDPPSPSPPTQPVAVPSAPREETQATRTEIASSIEPTDATHDYFIPQPSQYSRPPRLPLPIEEEPHTPGSPIISPTDVNELDLDPETLPRRAASVLSSTKDEEEDLEEEFQPPAPGNVPTVPTLIEWEGPGERVYVTGTFAGWNRKYRLHRNGPSPKKDVLSAIVNIAPGTHHLTFLVDNDMRTSDKLPTAVDYTNSLVNYLEVSYDDIPQPAASAAEEPKKPDPTPVHELRAPPGIYPPQTLPPTPELVPVKQSAPEPPQQPKVTAPSTPPKDYHTSIPFYLLDLDAPEESERFARANAAASNLPTPPTLPMFLSKSILNGTTPMKDDSSVLIMPNHTVLNHLATSSIKDNILATSATTRYRQKFLTTIMYKPKNEDPDHLRD